MSEAAASANDAALLADYLRDQELLTEVPPSWLEQVALLPRRFVATMGRWGTSINNAHSDVSAASQVAAGGVVATGMAMEHPYLAGAFSLLGAAHISQRFFEKRREERLLPGLSHDFIAAEDEKRRHPERQHLVDRLFVAQLEGIAKQRGHHHDSDEVRRLYEQVRSHIQQDIDLAFTLFDIQRGRPPELSDMNAPADIQPDFSSRFAMDLDYEH